MKKEEYEDEIQEILITKEEIEARVIALGEEITAVYQGQEIIMVGILRGAVIFMSDLARKIRVPVTFDFMDVTSYGQQAESSGIVRIIKDLEENIQGSHVLIVEDIIDTGLTLKYVVNLLLTRDPASIKICTLLDKPDRRQEKQVTIDFNGFEIPDHFVVGYGLDYAEKYRNLEDICLLSPRVYQD